MVAFAVLAFVFGACVGSFLNVIADRLPAGRSFWTGRSACDACGTPLRSLDLVPVLSYLALRGRCRYCHASIPRRVPVIELVSGFTATWAYLAYGFAPATFAVVVVLGFLLVVTIIDYEHQLVPNRLVAAGSVLGIALAAFWPGFGFPRYPGVGDWQSLSGIVSAVAAGFAGFGLLFVVYLLSPNGMGGGDVKLAFVLGLFVGLPGIAVALWVGAILGGVWAVMLLLFRRAHRKDAIPFAPFLSAGAAIALVETGAVLTHYHHMLITGSWL